MKKTPISETSSSRPVGGYTDDGKDMCPTAEVKLERTQTPPTTKRGTRTRRGLLDQQYPNIIQIGAQPSEKYDQAQSFAENFNMYLARSSIRKVAIQRIYEAANDALDDRDPRLNDYQISFPFLQSEMAKRTGLNMATMLETKFVRHEAYAIGRLILLVNGHPFTRVKELAQQTGFYNRLDGDIQKAIEACDRHMRRCGLTIADIQDPERLRKDEVIPGEIDWVWLRRH